MKKGTRGLEIEWRILILAAVMLMAFALPVQKFYMDKLKHTLERSVDPHLESLLRSFIQNHPEENNSDVAASLQRHKQWQALIPIIIEEQNMAMVLLSVMLFISLLLLAFWSLRRLTRPLKNLAFAAEMIGKGREVIILKKSGGALGKLEQSMGLMQEELIKLRERSRAQGMEAAWRDIARVMAHEIKNPLTPIQLTLDRVQEKIENGNKISDEELSRFVGRIGSQVEHLERLVNDFRSFAKEPEPQLKKVRLADCIESVSQDFKDVLAISISGDALINADPHLLNRCLINLWKNSLEASATKMQVIISRDSSEVKLRISDNGTGIPSENMERIWIPYVTFKKGGTGLGLPVVKRILESMNADVELTSFTGVNDHGVTFTITFLPLKELS